MNTRKTDDKNYEKMMATLEAHDGVFTGENQATSDGKNNDLCGSGPESRKIIDYIFYKGNGRKANKITRRIPYLRKRWNRKHQDLSDHFPVAVEVVF